MPSSISWPGPSTCCWRGDGRQGTTMVVCCLMEEENLLEVGEQPSANAGVTDYSTAKSSGFRLGTLLFVCVGYAAHPAPSQL